MTGITHSVAYKLLSSYCSSPHLGESGYSDVDNCHNPRKRIYLEHLPPLESAQPLSKKLKHPSEYHLLTVLTRQALEELDQRNTQPAYCSQANRRPVTRQAVAKWKEKEENWEPTQPAADFLTCCSGHLEEVKLFARHGGPDLSDLRGVCMNLPDVLLACH
jgi:hypothetical protein